MEFIGVYFWEMWMRDLEQWLCRWKCKFDTLYFPSFFSKFHWIIRKKKISSSKINIIIETIEFDTSKFIIFSEQKKTILSQIKSLLF